ncbi:translation initiation factor Sui1 [Desulfogranum mediterraneum]|uniref:translation initiation factor Sui1 n=1 Tax=Desulfogranum mediterraneum TaxID=160661 RepID=UPI0003F5B2CD|nr:translation initiation factor Sui1 [Desulfogranum mediterraneum]
MKNKLDNLVYSTAGGRICPGCNQPVARCCCQANREQAQAKSRQSDGVVRLSRQTKGRKGSGVTLISGIPLAAAELKPLAKKLKKQCGSGGTIKDGVIEIQGDHRQLLLEALGKLGYRVKLAGG